MASEEEGSYLEASKGEVSGKNKGAGGEDFTRGGWWERRHTAGRFQKGGLWGAEGFR